jgi:hypothetical protein
MRLGPTRAELAARELLEAEAENEGMQAKVAQALKDLAAARSALADSDLRLTAAGGAPVRIPRDENGQAAASRCAGCRTIGVVDGRGLCEYCAELTKLRGR